MGVEEAEHLPSVNVAATPLVAKTMVKNFRKKTSASGTLGIRLYFGRLLLEWESSLLFFFLRCSVLWR